MHSWKTAILTLLIFGLGGVAGGLITAQVIKGKIETAKTRPAGGDFIAAEWVPQTVIAMERHVKLSPDQVEKVRAIMKNTQQEVMRGRDTWRQLSREAVRRTDDSIMALLNADQRPLFKEFIVKRAEILRRRQQQMPPNGLPPRPGERMEQRRENGLAPFRNPPQPAPPNNSP